MNDIITMKIIAPFLMTTIVYLATINAVISFSYPQSIYDYSYHFHVEEDKSLGMNEQSSYAWKLYEKDLNRKPTRRFKRSFIQGSSRLPINFKPTFYDLEIQPHIYSENPWEFYFNGTVRIEMECLSSTKEIVLHGKYLKIEENSVAIAKVGSGNEVLYPVVEIDKENDFLILKANREMLSGSNYSVIIHYNMTLGYVRKGLYVNEYKRQNKTIYYVSTQMEPTDARRVLPCFDEPAIKALFRVTVVRKKHMISLSNAQLDIQEYRGDNWIADRYKITPLMSTYLLALVVCDFKYTTMVTKNNVTIRAWSRPDVVNQTVVALQTASKVLEYFEEYFEIPFPINKIDMVASQMYFGAMENWGLIIFKEKYMLYDSNEHPHMIKEIVETTVVHEIAHQWFGNLVTMSWWDDLWLNEGLTTFASFMGISHIHPEVSLMDRFIQYQVNVLEIDSLTQSHPVVFPMTEFGSNIIYFKGASVTSMIKFFLGDETFRRGLQTYLKKFSYTTVSTDDLFYTLGNQSFIDGHKVYDVKKIFDTWVRQKNYPLVTVTKLGNSLTLSQSRYLVNPEGEDLLDVSSPFGYRWEIPFTYTTSLQLNFRPKETDIIWMGKNEEEVIIPDAMHGAFEDDWYIGNVMHYGLYRVNYPVKNWSNLIKQLKRNHEVIDIINRVQIMDDAWNLAKSGHMPIDIPFRCLEYLTNEESILPFNVYQDEIIEYVDLMLQNTDKYDDYLVFMRSTFTTPFHKFEKKVTDESYFEMINVFQTACFFDSAECVEKSLRLFRSFMAENMVIDRGIQPIVYCTAVRNGGLEIWHFLFNKLVQDVKTTDIMLLALACSRNETLLIRLLDFTVLPENPKDFAKNALEYMSVHVVGRSVAWKFVKDNWDIINDRYIRQGDINMINVLTGFNTDEERESVYDFINSNGISYYTFADALNKINKNIEWMKTNYPLIESWLMQRKKAMLNKAGKHHDTNIFMKN